MEKTMTKKRYYTLSILIPAVMILAIFLLFTITPFGNRTWLTIDLGQQYVDFFSYSKTLSCITQSNSSIASRSLLAEKW